MDPPPLGADRPLKPTREHCLEGPRGMVRPRGMRLALARLVGAIPARREGAAVGRAVRATSLVVLVCLPRGESCADK